MSGMETSSSTRSGGSSRASARAAGPSGASTTRYPTDRRRRERSRRISGSSSTTSTRSVGTAGAGVAHAGNGVKGSQRIGEPLFTANGGWGKLGAGTITATIVRVVCPSNVQAASGEGRETVKVEQSGFDARSASPPNSCPRGGSSMWYPTVARTRTGEVPLSRHGTVRCKC